MTEDITEKSKQFTSSLLQKWNELDIKAAVAPLLKFADEHPIAILFVGILSGLAVLPLLIFFTFIAMTLMFTLFGFLLIEGTLLSFATIILAIVLFGVVVTSFMFTTFLVFIWFAAATSSVGIQKLKHVIQTRVPVMIDEQGIFQIDNPHSQKKTS